MKKWIALLLTLNFLLALAACGTAPASSMRTSSEAESGTAVESSKAVSEPISQPISEESSAEPAAKSSEEPSEEAEKVTEEPDGTMLVLYFDYSENMGDTSGMTADAITSASLAGEYYDDIGINNLLVMADEIQRQTGADLFSVRVTEPYDPDYGNMVGVAQEDQNNDKQFAFVEDMDLGGYDTIYIGIAVAV